MKQKSQSLTKDTVSNDSDYRSEDGINGKVSNITSI